MHWNENEITLLYNCDQLRDRKTLTYAASMGFKVNKQDLRNGLVSASVFQMMLDNLQIHPKHLINRADPYYQSSLKGKSNQPYFWWNAIKRMPHLLIAPIAHHKGSTVICLSPTDVFKVRMAGNRLNASA